MNNFGRQVAQNLPTTLRCLASVADNVNEIMKTKNSGFSAEKLNGNSAKQLL